MESRKYTNFVIIHNFKLVIKGTIKINKQIHLQKKPNKNKPNQTIKSLKKNYNLKNDERTFFFLKVTQLCLTLCDNIQSMEFSRPEYWSGWPFSSPGDLPNPGIEPRSPTLLVDSLPVEPQGKTKYTGVGSLSLLQQIFSTQELNWGLLNCRRILYQLSYQGEELRASESV